MNPWMLLGWVAVICLAVFMIGLTTAVVRALFTKQAENIRSADADLGQVGDE